MAQLTEKQGMAKAQAEAEAEAKAAKLIEQMRTQFDDAEVQNW